jgi:transposase
MWHLYERLKNEKDYKGSYDSVKKYVRKKKYLMKQARDGFLPLAQPQAHAQIDFGDFKYYDGMGNGREGHALVITFPHSNAGWMQVFPSENQECLLEGMKRIFKHIGGVPIRVKADNMTTAVAPRF